MVEDTMSQSDNDNKLDSPIFRLLEKRDMDNIMNLMEEIKPILGGVRYRSVYYALCQEALKDNRVVFAVCEDNSKIIGFSIAIIDLNHWRIVLMVRHPIVATKIVFGRTLNKLIRTLNKNKTKTNNNEPFNMSDLNEFITQMPTSKSWTDSAPQIAKSLFVAVTGSHRGKHLAQKLVEYRNKVLAERGQKRVDDRILLNNIGAVRLHYRMGYDIYNRGNGLFITKDLQ